MTDYSFVPAKACQSDKFTLSWAPTNLARSERAKLVGNKASIHEFGVEITLNLFSPGQSRITCS